MKVLIASTLIAISSLAAMPAQAADEHAGHHGAAAKPAAGKVQLVDGQVKKVDKAAGKVTLAHAPLVNLDMPAMTMAFQVKNAAWLDQMKAGDKIRFKADSIDGRLTVVQFEPAK
jgi:Cu(I)/Ag(I) efflux system protein CusF